MGFTTGESTVRITTRHVTSHDGETNVCETSSHDMTYPVTGMIPNATSQKELNKGDHAHAASYNASFRDSIPISSNFVYRTEWSDKTDPTHNTVCGEGPQWFCVYTVPGWYLANCAELDPPLATDPSFLLGMAETSALADLNRSLVNVPLLLAERKETLALLVNKGRQLSALISKTQRNSLRRYFKTARKDRRRVARDIANEHLGVLFGALPLIGEIDGLRTLLSQEAVFKITGRGRRSERDSSVDRQVVAPQGPPSAFDVCYAKTITKSTRVSVRVSLTMNIRVAGCQTVRDLGFNPLATAYDLVPLSFLSDFVSNLGTFVRSLDPNLGLEFFTGSQSWWYESIEEQDIRATSQHVSSAEGYPLGSFTRTGVGAGKAFCRALKVTRGVYVDLPDASLHFANNLTWGKALTVAALAIQRYVKPVRALIKLKPFRYKGKRPSPVLPPINYR